MGGPRGDAAAGEGGEGEALVKKLTIAPEQEIDPENFSLGTGPMKLKRAKLDRFIQKLKEDE